MPQPNKTGSRKIKSLEKIDDSDLFKVHNKDARSLLEIVPPQSVDVTITSPPYFDLKDYGSEKQIGFGQDYTTYLADLRDVFQKVHTVTKNNGSLWIIIDTFRKAQELLPLPFDLASELKQVGWSLKDVIIWKKERTLPWTKSGATRNIIEYILVFSKQGHSHQYFPDRQREIHDLKHWWVKYPERYNQKGKSLEEIWEFDIPTQGSWGDGYVRHFCPLPEGLVQRIINLTTNKGDIVLDPFSGSGTVPAQAHFQSRRFIGFELNSDYIEQFENYVAKKSKATQAVGSELAVTRKSFEDFEDTIINLRILKLGRIVLKAILKEHSNNLIMFAEKSLAEPVEKFKIATANYVIFTLSDTDRGRLIEKIQSLLRIPPYSKFGIEAHIRVENNLAVLEDVLECNGSMATYTLTNSHQVKTSVTSLNEISTKAPILSNIKLYINENDYK